MSAALPPIGWGGIARLGLVQACLGAVVVLTTSTLNRVMVVELGLPALLPGLLVGLHYVLQVLRPRMGYGSDVGGRRTPWIVGGMATLALGGFTAAAAVVWMGSDRFAGIALALFAFTLIGVGISAAGTSLLVLLAKRVDDARRAPAATVVWVMMIAGFAVTAGVAGQLLDPYSPARLLAVCGGVSAAAFVVSTLALLGVEGRGGGERAAAEAEERPAFLAALAQVWAEPAARRFTIFVFVSMLAFSAQDLILEPFAGLVFGYTPGESTKLSGVQHGGVLLGMIAVALAGGPLGRRWLPAAFGSLRLWTVGGCLVSGAALAGLVIGGAVGTDWPLRVNVFLMGLWGASQAIAFGLGGLIGATASDVARWLVGSPASAYGLVFLAEALLFVVAARLAWRVGRAEAPDGPASAPAATMQVAAVGLDRR
ncbi:MAG: BCD family MFS transporter [Burkholderiaceae bacterium]|nr:BCD family MFS transporter [Burkholderiaceae bacterium]